MALCDEYLQLDQANTMKIKAEKSYLGPSGFRTCSLSVPSNYKLTCHLRWLLWSLKSLQVGISRVCFIPAPNSCLVKSRLHLEGRERGIKDLAAPVLCLLRQVSDWFFLLHSGAMLINVSCSFYCYVMLELQTCCSSFNVLVSTYFFEYFNDRWALVISLESLCRWISIDLEMFYKICFCACLGSLWYNFLHVGFLYATWCTVY